MWPLDICQSSLCFLTWLDSKRRWKRNWQASSGLGADLEQLSYCHTYPVGQSKSQGYSILMACTGMWEISGCLCRRFPTFTLTYFKSLAHVILMTIFPVFRWRGKHSEKLSQVTNLLVTKPGTSVSSITKPAFVSIMLRHLPFLHSFVSHVCNIWPVRSKCRQLWVQSLYK